MNRRQFFQQAAALSVSLLVPAVARLPDVAAAAPGSRPPAAGTLAQTAAAAGTIYLTFDDGYIGIEAKVAALNALGVLGTFFLTGQAIYEHPGAIIDLLSSGHVLGNHTYDHADLTTLSRAGISRELNGCEQAARDVAGVSTRPLMRPPYGAINRSVRSVIADLGYRPILWDWDTRDWAGSSVDQIEHNFGTGIVLMHTQGRNTVAALTDIVPSLLAQGYTFGAL